MQVLLHQDYLLEAVRGKDSSLLKLCVENNVSVWVVSSSLPWLHQQLCQGMEEPAARETLRAFLSGLPVLPLTGKDLLNALEKSQQEYPVALAVTAVERFRLDAVVTLDPESFKETNVSAVRPDELPEHIKTFCGKAKSVPQLDIPATYPEILNDVEHEMAEVIQSGQFILGPKVDDLEEKVAEYCDCRYAVGVSSGTDALLLALMSAGIGPGDEVITSAFTFFATAGSITRVGAKPVFVDIDETSFNLDPNLVEAKITGRTKAIIPVHLYGQSADMDPILQLAKKRNLTVIEDAAQAIGSKYKNRKAGSIGDMGCLSFFPAKNLGGFGDGGMLTTSSQELYEKAKTLRAHGANPKYVHKMIGGNFRLDALLAAVIHAKLPYLGSWTDKRRQNAERYNQLFQKNNVQEFISLPEEKFSGHVYNQYVIRVSGSKRDELKSFLQEQNIATEVYYPIPLHLQECYRSLGYKEGEFPVAEKVAHEVLALPVSHEISIEQQEYVVEGIKTFFS